MENEIVIVDEDIIGFDILDNQDLVFDLSGLTVAYIEDPNTNIDYVLQQDIMRNIWGTLKEPQQTVSNEEIDMISAIFDDILRGIN